MREVGRIQELSSNAWAHKLSLLTTEEPLHRISRQRITYVSHACRLCKQPRRRTPSLSVRSV
ncbi:hypothetical protein BDZ85DRAFT_255597 [Elsinoe ampelina]|uniref:Uncharacterized protein n=1 Tax=Elsinoe ampelina TaxID=302913 RepID=A0A6A6GR44_9PEZI|nr:hypothetical protein BDZ85DRAFT_255597 [Elsinoe ampelina]